MSRLLESETLTLLILLAIARLAGCVLGAGCKDILSNLISGLLGFLTKSVLSGYSDLKAAVSSAVPSAPSGLQELPEQAGSKETEWKAP